MRQKETVKFDFPLCLAPMVGLSHVVLRKIIFDYMPKDTTTIWPTEMLNSRRIPHEKLGYTAETLLFAEENNLVPQILGNEQEAIELTVKKMQTQWLNANQQSPLKGIDINMGCPVQKALKHNYGVALMGDLDYAARVVAYASEATDLPISVKLRAVGSEKSIPELIHFVQTLKNAGANWVTLHPRTAAQKRKGFADWSQIRELKKAVDIPIIGNGDVQTWHDVIAMKESTNCDVVMSGRGLAARPWMVWQLGHHLGLKNNSQINENQKPPLTEEEEGAEFGRVLLKFIRLSEYYFCEVLGHKPDYAFRKIQFYLRTTHVWLEFGHALTSEVSKAKSFAEMHTRVESFFNQPQRMCAYTELRQ